MNAGRTADNNYWTEAMTWSRYSSTICFLCYIPVGLVTITAIYNIIQTAYAPITQLDFASFFVSRWSQLKISS